MNKRQQNLCWTMSLILILFCVACFISSNEQAYATEVSSATPAMTEGATATASDLETATPMEMQSSSPSETPVITVTPSETPTPTPVITPTPFPSEPAPDDYLVKIGLKHGSSCMEKVTLTSDTGGTLGVVTNGTYTAAVGFKATDTFLAKTGSGCHHILLTTGTTNFLDAQYALCEIKQILVSKGITAPIFYVHNGSAWYVGAGIYFETPQTGTKDSNGLDLWTILSEALSETAYAPTAYTAKNNTIRTYINNIPVLILSTDTVATKIRVHPLLLASNNAVPPLLRLDKARYRGNLDLYRISGSNINVVNELEIEEYLYSVVPAEMIAGKDTDYNIRIEGLKAQAILARTKAYASVLNGGVNAYFHLYCDVNSQMYGGYTNQWGSSGEHNNSTQAVILTKEMVLTYQGKIINSLFYSANSGGYIETANNVWWSNPAYYVSKPDPWTEPDISTPSFTGKQLSAQMATYILNSKGTDIGDVRYVNIISRSQSGRVIEMLVEGSKKDDVLTKQAVRSVLGLRSQLYTFNAQATITIQNQSDGTSKTLSDRARTYLEGNTFTTAFLPDSYAVRSKDGYVYERIRVYANSTAQSFTLTVKGHGHGCGMSQDGADAMSKAGKKYDEIIKFYIPGATITNIKELL